MEAMNQSRQDGNWRPVAASKATTLLIGLLAACYVVVLPMAGTIALRNVVLFALCMCLGSLLLRSCRPVFCPWPVVLWALYLLLFPILSDSPYLSVSNFFSQWGRGLLAMLVGAGVARFLNGDKRNLPFYIGLASAVPLLVHLVLFAWKAWETRTIPWGYWGRETHHADLGYAAGQAVVLLSASLATGGRVHRRWAAALIAACLLSTVFANSRAGLTFALVGGFLVLCCIYSAKATRRRSLVLFIMGGFLIAGMAVVSVSVKEDPRWHGMAAQLFAGFSGDALQIECEGISAVEPQIFAQYGAGDMGQRIMYSLQGGDGARVVLLRAGLALSVKHPWGSDGSKLAYQNLLREECPDPVILMAHTHNGWLDTALALGWAGAALYLMVLIYFFAFGFTTLRNSNILNEWALALAGLSAFWMLRGLIDSVYKDHMLEMQGFVLAYAVANLWMQGLRPTDVNRLSQKINA